MMGPITCPIPPHPRTSPLAWRAWREERFSAYPIDLQQLVVEIDDPHLLAEAERTALRERIARFGFSLFALRHPPTDLAAAKEAVRALGCAFGLRSLDANLLADDDGITPIAVHHSGERARYIPYTDQPIQWHTDGYYNAPERRVRSLILYCVQPALRGGENRLFDPAIAFLLLGEQNPAYLDALMRPNALSIPPGRGPDGEARGWSRGPVFLWEQGPHGWALLMRFTARKRHILWEKEPTLEAARDALLSLLNDPTSPFTLSVRLESGMGLIGQNILHTREPFTDALEPQLRRLLLRARYLDFLENTVLPKGLSNSAAKQRTIPLR
ncbi:MAG: TauD/TfdA family dioxygenase [Hydrogenophilus sp.]|nr:TauD/TfdA family dioxygenase [Hydrogenophilus sp.]